MVKVEDMFRGEMRTMNIVVGVALIATTCVVGVAYGQANFEGIWVPNNQSGQGGGPRRNDVSLTPAGQAEFDSFGSEDDPAFLCIMPGIPKGFTDPYPIEIIQQDHQIVLLYEYFHQVRRVFIDGREAPDYWPISLMGYSTGVWEGETLVVRTTHLSPDNYMDPRGLPFSGSEDTYVIERYLRSGNELTLAVEVHDPTYYEETYVRSRRWTLTPDGEIWDYECDPNFGNVG